jgi:hypothetical protein
LKGNVILNPQSCLDIVLDTTFHKSSISIRAEESTKPDCTTDSERNDADDDDDDDDDETCVTYE